MHMPTTRHIATATIENTFIKSPVCALCTQIRDTGIRQYQFDFVSFIAVEMVSDHVGQKEIILSSSG